MDPDETETKNGCAREGQQKLVCSGPWLVASRQPARARAFSAEAVKRIPIVRNRHQATSSEELTLIYSKSFL
jgi:hypothetical protein